MKKLLAFIFTNYNNSHFTIKMVESIQNIKIDQKPIIIIVDNNSAETEKKKLIQLEIDFPDIIILFNKENSGYFKGLNYGISYLHSKLIKVDYLIIGNNDLTFPSNFFELLLSKKSITSKYAVISPNIITDNGKHQNPQVINKIGVIREFIYDIFYSSYTIARIINKFSALTNKFTSRSDNKEYLKSQIIYQGHGSCYILTPIFWEYFDELFAPSFLMGEEYFLSFQLSQFDLNIYYESSIIVRHRCHSSIEFENPKKIWEYAKKSHLIRKKYLPKFNKREIK